jgi:hypothetical protein
MTEDERPRTDNHTFRLPSFVLRLLLEAICLSKNFSTSLNPTLHRSV